MSEERSTRRNFLKLVGMSAGVSLAGAGTFSAFVDHAEIRRLNPEQQEFMVRYGKWMEEFRQIVKIQKRNPDDLNAQKKMIEIAEIGEKFKPELAEHMKDKAFEIILRTSIERVSKEIQNNNLIDQIEGSHT